jgi:hypothetical protein
VRDAYAGIRQDQVNKKTDIPDNVLPALVFGAIEKDTNIVGIPCSGKVFVHLIDCIRIDEQRRLEGLLYFDGRQRRHSVTSLLFEREGI